MARRCLPYELASDSGHIVDAAPQTAYISGKQQDVVQLYFGNSPKSSLLISKVDANDGSPLSDVEFLVTTSDGTLLGNANGKYVTDSTGTILIENLDPNLTLVVKETRCKPNYILDDVPQTIKTKPGKTVKLEFRNKKQGNLVIHKLSSADKSPIEGAQFKLTYADGKVVDAASGQLSSNGLYWSNTNTPLHLIVPLYQTTRRPSRDGIKGGSHANQREFLGASVPQAPPHLRPYYGSCAAVRRPRPSRHGRRQHKR